MENVKTLLVGGGGTRVHDFKAICAEVQKILAKDGRFRVDYVEEDLDAFRASRIRPYELCILYYTGGKLTTPQKNGLLEWLARGNGFVGIHSATVSFERNPEYVAMLGSKFVGHPFVRDYTVSLADEDHPITRDIKGYTVKDWEEFPVFEYTVHDEQYVLDYDPRVHLLATAVYKGVSRPVAYVKSWGEGRVFYLALGHDAQAARNPFFREILARGAFWAARGEPQEQQ